GARRDRGAERGDGARSRAALGSVGIRAPPRRRGARQDRARLAGQRGRRRLARAARRGRRRRHEGRHARLAGADGAAARVHHSRAAAHAGADARGQAAVGFSHRQLDHQRVAQADRSVGRDHLRGQLRRRTAAVARDGHDDLGRRDGAGAAHGLPSRQGAGAAVRRARGGGAGGAREPPGVPEDAEADVAGRRRRDWRTIPLRAMGYLAYYLFFFVISYTLRYPWLLAAVVVVWLSRRWLPDPYLYFKHAGHVRRLKAEIAHNAENATARRDLAKIWLAKKRPRRAIVLLEEARRRDRDSAELPLLLGTALYGAGRADEALPLLVEAAGKNERQMYGEAYLVAGKALRAL